MASLHQELRSIFDSQITAATQLLELLKKEHDAVADQNADDIEQLLNAKQAQIECLETLTTKQDRLLVEAGFNPSRSTTEKFLIQHDTGGSFELINLWHRLSDVVMQCRDQNQRNGRLVTLRRRKTEQALNILRGQSPDSQSYGPDGTAVSGTASRPLTTV